MQMSFDFTSLTTCNLFLFASILWVQNGPDKSIRWYKFQIHKVPQTLWPFWLAALTSGCRWKKPRKALPWANSKKSSWAQVADRRLAASIAVCHLLPLSFKPCWKIWRLQQPRYSEVRNMPSSEVEEMICHYRPNMFSKNHRSLWHGSNKFKISHHKWHRPIQRIVC